MIKPRILFMGTPQFAVPALALLVESGYPLAGVVTQPDKPQGRGRMLQPSAVKAFALSGNLPVVQPQQALDIDFLQTLRQLEPDLIALAAFGQILPKEILNLPPMGCLNIHPSILPKYRGAAPINWAIINGEKITGVTIMQMVEEPDAGDIFLQEEVSIGPEETYDQLHDRLSHLGAELLVKTVEMIMKGTAHRIAQDGSASTYAPRLKKENGLIRWDDEAAKIVNLIRGLSSYPGAYTFLDGKKLKVFGAKAEAASPDKSPGTISVQKGMGLIVASGNGCVRLLDVQLENKKRMRAEDFLRGFHVRPGSVLRPTPYDA